MKVIALDFDGVLHDYKGVFTANLNPPVPGAQQFVETLKKNGFKLIVFSVRAETAVGLIQIERWLKKYGFPELSITNKKPQASLYVDDRGFRFEGKFDEVLNYIEKVNPDLKPWNQ